MTNLIPEPGALRFDPQTGLIPAVVQDAQTARVLMLGYMSRESLERTGATGLVTFHSRERGRQWTKGETSGNTLICVEVRPDCDADSLLVRAIPQGPTCHTGQISCFGEPQEATLGEVLGELLGVIEERKAQRPAGSYTAQLLGQAVARVAQKVVEEASELALDAAAGGSRAAEEAADLLYHTLVLLAALGRKPEEVAQVLRGRRR